MAHSQYPRDLQHPNGFRTVTVFDIEEEKRVNAEHAQWRKDMLEAERKNRAGEAHEVKRGPGRPRQENDHG